MTINWAMYLNCLYTASVESIKPGNLNKIIGDASAIGNTIEHLSKSYTRVNRKAGDFFGCGTWQRLKPTPFRIRINVFGGCTLFDLTGAPWTCTILLL